LWKFLQNRVFRWPQSRILWKFCLNGAFSWPPIKDLVEISSKWGLLMAPH
jgi:hypothetical protein